MDRNGNASQQPDTVGRRCFLTVLFSDVSGSSQHAEELEAESYAALLAQFRRFAREIILRHGGSIARQQGDGVLALFGIHDGDEEDGRRATLAALELHSAVGCLRIKPPDGDAMQLHSGIHTGLVLLLEGDIERGRFDVVGEVPNTAARLCAMAEPGEVLVSQESLGPREQLFQLKWKRRVAVRGRRSPLDVLSVNGTNELRRRIDAAARRGVVPFVGREGVLGTLLEEAARAGAHAEKATLLHISGEPGVGKTRLLDEFKRGLDTGAFLVVQGYCEGHFGARPLQPFLSGLSQAIKTDASEGAQMVGAGPLADALCAEGDARMRLDATEMARPAAIIELIQLLAADRPVVLVLDDWQWADDASRKVLHQLLSDMRSLLVVLASRRGTMTEDPTVDSARLIELEPLDPPDASNAIRAWIPGADEFMVQHIFHRSGGSPLFLEELCHAALAGEEFAPVTTERGVAWINALVASRLTRLPPSLAERLQAASVIGNVVPLALMRSLFGADVDLSMHQLVEDDFLMPLDAASMRFRHGLTRDAVYATVESTLRMRWHLRVAQILEAQSEGRGFADSLEALAYHYHAAQRSEQAARFAVAAGDKALSASALDRARAQYLVALQCLDSLPVMSQQTILFWCSIAERLAQTCVFDPLDMAESAPKFERALSLARQSQDANALARAEYWMAYVNYGSGRPRDAIRFCRLALEHAQLAGDVRLHAQLQATLGQSLASAGRYDEALPTLRDAVESKRQRSRAGSGTAIGSAYCVARMGYTLGDLGRFEEAHALLEEAMQMLGTVEHSLRASIWELVCAVHLWQGRWSEAREAGRAGEEVAWRCRSRYLTAMGRALGGCAVWAIQRDVPSYDALLDATYLIDARGGAVSTSLNFGWLLEAATTLGLQADVRRHQTKLLQRARQQDRHGHGMGCRALSRQLADQGDFAGARRMLHNARRSAAARGSAREHALNDYAWAQLAARAGHHSDARARLDGACAAFERMKMQWHLGEAIAFGAGL